ncbi:hypothetical protein KC338_g38 [Hortaea werneckii]|nr:hypothetical protein KC338_g38 [Hortaea werneckii]
MDETTVRRLVEHRDILQGFDAQIARLDREEDELFGRIIRARNRDEAQVVFDALAKVKERRQRLGKERQDEAIAFGHLVSQSQLGGLPGTRSADEGKRQEDGPSQPSPTDAIDGDDEEPMKREGSTPDEGSVLGSTTSSGGRQPQRSATGRTCSPFPGTLKGGGPAAYGAERYPSVAKTHPTLTERISSIASTDFPSTLPLPISLQFPQGLGSHISGRLSSATIVRSRRKWWMLFRGAIQGPMSWRRCIKYLNPEKRGGVCTVCGYKRRSTARQTGFYLHRSHMEDEQSLHFQRALGRAYEWQTRPTDDELESVTGRNLDNLDNFDTTVTLSRSSSTSLFDIRSPRPAAMDDHGDVDQNEHQKVMDGFGAQIGRLNRKLDSLRDQLIAAGDAATVEKLFDERAATKKQKEELEKLQQAELAEYNSALLMAHTKTLPPAREQKPRLIVTPRPSLQEIIDLTQDDISPATKRERSVSPKASGPKSKILRSRRGRQQFSERDVRQVAQDRPKPKVRRMTTATSRALTDARKFLNFPVIAESHPTLVPSPDGSGAVELRCCVCGCNALNQEFFRASKSPFFNGIRGLLTHIRQAHADHRLGKTTVQAAAAIRGCTHAHVPQEVVDAITSGDVEAYTVPVISVMRRLARSLRVTEDSDELLSEEEREVTSANRQATIASADEQHDMRVGHWPFQPMVPLATEYSAAQTDRAARSSGAPLHISRLSDEVIALYLASLAPTAGTNPFVQP